MSYYIPETLKDIAEQVRQGQHPAVTGPHVAVLVRWTATREIESPQNT